MARERYDDAEQIEAARMDADDYERICELPNRIGVDLEELEGSLRGLGMVDIADRLKVVTDQFFPIEDAIRNHTEPPDDGRDGGTYTKIGWIYP